MSDPYVPAWAMEALRGARGSDTQTLTARTPWRLCQAGVRCCSAVLSMLCV